ncbi:MAG: hypothetical protein KAW17_00980 [Candidatus Eisenbacteria sp.]|nr:hypothetical protein [Candidatus Eisenbacteria bacterium]
MCEKDAEWAKDRLERIRRGKRTGGDALPGANAIEQLFFEVADIPSLYFSGNDRSRGNSVTLENGRAKYPDFRFRDEPDKVIEVVGTYSHPPGYPECLAEAYKAAGMPALVLQEPDIVKDPRGCRRAALLFYGKCPFCGAEFTGDAQRPIKCRRCGKEM